MISGTMTVYRNSDQEFYLLKGDEEEGGAVLCSRFNHGRQIRVLFRLECVQEYFKPVLEKWVNTWES